MAIVSLIVAVTENGVIGKDNDLPWRQETDMKYFRDKTKGHPNIMGRRTHMGIGRPLPNRQNIVVTRNPDEKFEGCVTVTSIPAAIEAAEETDEIFIIGGGSIYKQALEQGLVDKMYVTEIHTTLEGDTFFTFDPAAWQEVSREDLPADEKNQYPYSFVIYTKK